MKIKKIIIISLTFCCLSLFTFNVFAEDNNSGTGQTKNINERITELEKNSDKEKKSQDEISKKTGRK